VQQYLSFYLTNVWYALEFISRFLQMYDSDLFALYVTAHYEQYAHDEWSIRDLLHWQNYPSLPIIFPCFESRGI
jgi:hypothetical protein